MKSLTNDSSGGFIVQLSVLMEASTLSLIKTVRCAESGLTNRSALRIPACSVQPGQLRIPDLSTRNNVSTCRQIK